MNRLSVRRVSLQVPWLGKGDAATVDFLDWEIDGVSLRERYDADTEMTLLQDEEWIRPHRAEAIARLRGKLTDPPTYVPEFHQTRLEKRLGRKGAPIARFGAAFDDARVGLLFCVCGDIDCPTLSAEVVVSGDVVQWRDIGWQVSYAPFGADITRELDEYGHATFDRAEYDALMASLLDSRL